MQSAFTMNTSGEVGLQTTPPLSLYVHIPWCLRKCPYCDFNSHAASDIPESAYIDALARDLESALPGIWGRKIHSVFFGGGTPSLFSPEGIDRILTQVRTLTFLEPYAEITLEANPGTIESGKFHGFRDVGVNRLSIGIQSFEDEKLRAIGRIHDGAEARAAAELATQTFSNFNLDLMYGLPGQALNEALDDIEAALSFNPTHLSCYHLTLEPNTPFGHRPPSNLPDEDACFEMQVAIEKSLGAAGFAHYETSAFARRKYRSLHNLNYWMFGDYLGIGAGAHSKLSFHDRIVRQMRVKHPRQYIESTSAGHAIAEERTVAAKDLPFEFMMNALRLIEGFELSLFSERTGLPLNGVLKKLEEAESMDMIHRSALHLGPTLKGQRFLNDLLALFLA
jgi:putative oxygen-independent coproporphyrinogen III oxidase